MKQFNECYRIRGSLFCPHKIADKVIEICDWLTEGVKMWNWFNKFYLFYMGRKQQKKVCKKNAELPSEYCFDDVRPDSDGRNEWERIRYKCYPSVAVRRGNRLMGIGYLRFRSEYVYHEHSSIPQEDESSVKSALKTRFYQKCIRSVQLQRELI
ncbi:unnamed protein product [Anisakis simplex]|uniref:Uncharacterized protein n=1 Tax=Anisakis simplex TaxID=6269 RepID=A0A3P6NES5_ANISI|nr:unnamed protein product [Anisakis simplex]